MSQRVTRSQTQSVTPGNEGTSTKRDRVKSRPLTEEDLKRLKNFLAAAIAYRKRQGSPTDHENNPEEIIAALRRLFIQVAKKNEDIKTRGAHDEKWLDFAKDLIKSGVTSWQAVDAGLKKAYGMIQFGTKNPLLDLLSEGHVREHVLNNMQISEYQTLFGTRHLHLSSEQRLDIILQFNNPKSQIHKNLKAWIQNREYKYCTWLLKTMYVSRGGRLIGLDINAHTKEAGSYLIDTLCGFRDEKKEEGLEFIRFLIADMKIDPLLPYVYKDGIINAASYALSRGDVYWDAVKVILRLKPLNEFYIDEHSRYGYYKNSAGSVVQIDNIWICKELRTNQIKWLLKHGGMDPRAMGDHHADIEEYFKFEIKKLNDQLDDIQKDISRTSDKIQELLSSRENVLDMVNAYQRILEQQIGLRSIVDTNYLQPLLTKKSAVADVLNQLNIRLGGAPKCRSTKM